ncbi:MAG: EAL domain-containing protein [Rhodospirillaceae bacterium]|nr:EAL domain-containing protein [Rhodospirillaceae bacterium]
MDDLTGLSTLRVFRVGLREALARAEQTGRAVAVLFADLDGFKLVNDTLGHTVGNRVLAAVGTRIRQQIRRSDMAARVGGDEFVVLLPEITCPDDAGRVAGALLGALDAPIEVDGHKIKIGASIGIAVAPDDSTDVDKLLEMADVAMYRVKKLGKRRFEFFASFCAGERSRRSSIEGQLRSALDGDQFVMHYQPIVDPGTGHACFFEALIRWQHPDRGLLLPHEFVPFLDETRLICQVGEWAVGRVAADAATLVRSGRPNAVVTINIDPKQWVMGDLAATIDRAVESNAIQHRNIALEIVESTMIQDFVWTREWLTAIREKGTTVFLDDFGSGYAALNYFMELPFDFVKIDRSILKRCPGDRVSLTLIQSIKFLARQLGIMVVAEGVETAFQHELIRTGGIPLAQGFHYCRPLPLDVLMSLFEPEAENSPDAYAPPFLPQRSVNRQAVAAARA